MPNFKHFNIYKQVARVLTSTPTISHLSARPLVTLHYREECGGWQLGRGGLWSR